MSPAPRRRVANYESINPRTLDCVYGLYNVCQIYRAHRSPANSQCLLRGVGGDYQHATLSGAWKRKVIDPVGGVWTAFAFARFVGSYLDYDRQGLYPIYNNFGEPIPNVNQGLFFNGQDQRFRGQALPGFGGEWRYPILARQRRLAASCSSRSCRSSPGRTRRRSPRSSTWTRRALSSTTRTCSNGANFRATTASRPARA